MGKNQRNRPAQPKGNGATAQFFKSFGEVIAKLIDRFGWPGAFLILGFSFIVYYGSAEQKREIIDRFVLGKGDGRDYLIGVITVVFGLLFWAQGLQWRRKLAKAQEEIDRLAKWKSDHQDNKSGGGLHSSD